MSDSEALNRIFIGRLLPERKGQRCRVVNTWRGRGPHNVRIEFADGHTTVCPVRCIRKANA